MATTHPIAKPEGTRLRRKLQKITNPRRILHPATTYPNDKRGRSPEPLRPATRTMASATQRPSPDLSDSKWQDYVRNSSCCEPLSLHVQRKQPSPAPLLDVIPELAYLKLHDPNSRKSCDTGSSSTTLTSNSTLLSSPSTRRYAKTPVFQVGQLECRSRKPNTAQKVSSVELIAESYRALLESRSDSIFADRNSDPSPISDERRIPDIRRRRSLDNVPRGAGMDVPRASKHVVGSPTSDAGTLVGFEEDAIYFKPVSFSPEPPPVPIRGRRSPQRPREAMSSARTPGLPENPSLQICFDLLQRELASAAQGGQSRPSDETSALQIWVMIEAYEKLRDQVLDAAGDDGQGGRASSLAAPFDMWLAALYALHDKMTGYESPGSEGEGEYIC